MVSHAAKPPCCLFAALVLCLPAVSRAEAGQQKRLLLLDRGAGWGVAEEVLLDVGPRHFAAAAVPAAVSAPAAEEAAAAVSTAGAAEEGAAAAASEAEAAAAAGLEQGAVETADAAAEAAAVAGFELQLPEGLRPGDRLLLTLPAAAVKQHQKQLKKLGKQGECLRIACLPCLYCHCRCCLAKLPLATC
jgi:hypothetical protein